MRRTLLTSLELEKASRAAARDPEGSLAAARLANAAAALGRLAVAALKARADVGDIYPHPSKRVEIEVTAVPDSDKAALAEWIDASP